MTEKGEVTMMEKVMWVWPGGVSEGEVTVKVEMTMRGEVIEI